MPVELTPELEALTRAAGEMWVAAVRLDEHLDSSDVWALVPSDIYEQYVVDLKELAHAYGKLRARQYEREHPEPITR